MHTPFFHKYSCSIKQKFSASSVHVLDTSLCYHFSILLNSSTSCFRFWNFNRQIIKIPLTVTEYITVNKPTKKAAPKYCQKFKSFPILFYLNLVGFFSYSVAMVIQIVIMILLHWMPQEKIPSICRYFHACKHSQERNRYLKSELHKHSTQSNT